MDGYGRRSMMVQAEQSTASTTARPSTRRCSRSSALASSGRITSAKSPPASRPQPAARSTPQPSPKRWGATASPRHRDASPDPLSRERPAYRRRITGRRSASSGGTPQPLCDQSNHRGWCRYRRTYLRAPPELSGLLALPLT
jgi:hypothetical protein